jgi:uncharacterized protein YecE (DUF72 family)
VAVLIGTSGWQYRDWRERFYPKGVAQKRWLEHYADRFQTVESNNAFYMLPKPETFRAWAERTPDDFVMAVKVNRYITHIRRLRDTAEPSRRYLEHCRNLGAKLGPVLLQLPPNLKADVANLGATLDALAGPPLAVEFRHESWHTDETRAALEARNVALCLADRGAKPVTELWRTADWGYVRFHEGTATPHPCYGRTSLSTWAQRIADMWGPDGNVYVYFNNDPRCCAVRDAKVFARAVERTGLRATRVPPERIPVG